MAKTMAKQNEPSNEIMEFGEYLKIHKKKTHSPGYAQCFSSHVISCLNFRKRSELDGD